MAKGTWFSQEFKLPFAQYQLPFIDFRLDRDVQLYLDPYAITGGNTDLSVACHNAIVSFFECLVAAVTKRDVIGVRRLVIGKFKEPKEIPLGVSNRPGAGRGFGTIQERQILEALSESTALATGLISDIQELELHVVGVGPDKISDLVANIISGLLATWTSLQCAKYGIPVTPVSIGPYWVESQERWSAGLFELPVFKQTPYILIPKEFVRKRQDLISHSEFYDKYMLPFLESELISATDSLVETLKNGKQRVTKKSMKNDPRFEFSKGFVSGFVRDHPEIMNQYRNELNTKFAPVDPAFYTEKSVLDDQLILQRIKELPLIAPGKADAYKFHDCIFDLLQFILDYSGRNWEKEFVVDDGLGRMDIVVDNVATQGFFADHRDQLNATTLAIECKNYVHDLGNKEFNQIESRLGATTTRLGIVVCRHVSDQTKGLKQLALRWVRQQ